jgi:hypothetical protein
MFQLKIPDQIRPAWIQEFWIVDVMLCMHLAGTTEQHGSPPILHKIIIRVCTPPPPSRPANIAPANALFLYTSQIGTRLINEGLMIVFQLKRTLTQTMFLSPSVPTRLINEGLSVKRASSHPDCKCSLPLKLVAG